MLEKAIVCGGFCEKEEDVTKNPYKVFVRKEDKEYIYTSEFIDEPDAFLKRFRRAENERYIGYFEKGEWRYLLFADMESFQNYKNQ